MRNSMIIIPTAIIAALPATSQAGIEKEPHFDTYFYVEDGRIKTGAILEEDAGTVGGPDPFIENVRIFGAEMGEEFPNFADEPGFDSEQSLFPGGTTSLGFRIIGALQEWDGSGFVPTVSTIDIEYLANPAATTPAGPTDIVNGFTADFLPNGTFHTHFDYTLNNPSTGIFMLALSMYAPGSDVAPSHPFYYVFNNGLDEEDHEAAIEFAEANVPAPGAGAILALTGALAASRRKRTNCSA